METQQTIQQKRKFFTAIDLPLPKPCEAGKKKYDWSYFDETGKVVKMSKNVYEEIQSNLEKTDYKKLIEEDNYGFNDDDIFMDTTELPRDFVEHCNHITNLANHINQMRENNQSQSVGQNSQQVEQVGQQSAEVSQQSATVEQQQGGGN